MSRTILNLSQAIGVNSIFLQGTEIKPTETRPLSNFKIDRSFKKNIIKVEKK